jgi:hypothetical protein
LKSGAYAGSCAIVNRSACVSQNPYIALLV